MLFLAPAQAQDASPDSIFRDYDHMRSVLDEGMMNRNIVTVMRAFGASDEMTNEELTVLEEQVKRMFPRPLTDVDLMKSVQLGPNWTQELYAYRGGLREYIYALVLFHTGEDAVVAVKFLFNTDPIKLLQKF